MDRSEGCGEELHHHCADDLPAYIVISIVAHIIVSAVLYTGTHFGPSYWTHLALLLPTTLILKLGLLQPTKGSSSERSGNWACMNSNTSKKRVARLQAAADTRGLANLGEKGTTPEFNRLHGPEVECHVDGDF
jgi:hypothetical protein